MSANALNHFVYTFSKIEAFFDEEYEKYIFKGNWASAITEEHFDPIINKIESDLLYQLKIGKNNDQYIKDLLEIIGKSLEWLHNNSIIQYLEKIKLVEVDILEAPYLLPITLDGRKYVLQDPYTLSPVSIEYDIVEKQKNLTIEQQYLFQSYMLFHDALLKLNDIIIQWEVDLPFTDFDKIEMTKSSLMQKTIKCQLNLSKIEIARLFYFLNDERIIFMEDDKSYSRLHLHKFIEKNFTYYNTKTKKYEPIREINKEFSEASSSINKKGNIKFFEKLIKNLKQRIDNIK